MEPVSKRKGKTQGNEGAEERSRWIASVRDQVAPMWQGGTAFSKAQLTCRDKQRQWGTSTRMGREERSQKTHVLIWNFRWAGACFVLKSWASAPLERGCRVWDINEESNSYSRGAKGHPHTRYKTQKVIDKAEPERFNVHFPQSCFLSYIILNQSFQIL